MMEEKKSKFSKDSQTISERYIKTADGFHKLYVQEWGNKSGAPILFIHGGPGSGCNDKHKSFFDPAKHRVIFVDQRGAGNSQPYGSLKENTTHK
jgi:proline iminopeptidase